MDNPWVLDSRQPNGATPRRNQEGTEASTLPPDRALPLGQVRPDDPLQHPETMQGKYRTHPKHAHDHQAWRESRCLYTGDSGAHRRSRPTLGGGPAIETTLDPSRRLSKATDKYCAGLGPPWKGPYEVIHQHSPQVFSTDRPGMGPTELYVEQLQLGPENTREQPAFPPATTTTPLPQPVPDGTNSGTQSLEW